MENKQTCKIVLAVLIALSIPIFGNFFIEGWNWGVLDFVFAGVLLLATVLAVDYALRNIGPLLHKTLAVAGILILLFLVWIELAVDAVSRSIAFVIG